MIKKTDLSQIILKAFSLLIPLKKKQISFESHTDFSDNSKALYLRMLTQLNREYKFYWFVEDASSFSDFNMKNTKFLTLESKNMFNKLRNFIIRQSSKFHFYTHRYCGPTFKYKRHVVVNLWHGIPLKDISSKLSDKQKSPIWNDYFLSTSEFSSVLLDKAFSNIKKHTIELGYPRNDLLFSDRKLFKEALGISEKTLIVYMPTFRSHKDSNRVDAYVTDEIPLINSESILAINKILSIMNTVMVIKIHPSQDISKIAFDNYTNILFINNEYLLEKRIDLYQILAESDILLSDYSSVYIDYLLTNKPIGFVISDLEKYKAGIGFLVDNILDYLPGKIIQSYEELIDFIKNVIYEHKDEFESARLAILSLFHEYKDNHSSDRLINFLINKSIN